MFRNTILSEIWDQDYFEYAEFNGDVHFFCFQPEIPVSGANLVQTIKIVSLSRNLVPRLIQTFRIQ